MIFHHYNYQDQKINKDQKYLIFQKVIMKNQQNNQFTKVFIPYNNVILTLKEF